MLLQGPKSRHSDEALVFNALSRSNAQDNLWFCPRFQFPQHLASKTFCKFSQKKNPVLALFQYQWLSTKRSECSENWSLMEWNIMKRAEGKKETIFVHYSVRFDLVKQEEKKIFVFPTISRVMVSIICSILISKCSGSLCVNVGVWLWICISMFLRQAGFKCVYSSKKCKYFY